MISVKKLAERMQVPRSTLSGYLYAFGGVDKLRGIYFISKPSKKGDVG